MPRKPSQPNFWRQKPTVVLDEIILKRLHEITGNRVLKLDMVHGLASVVIQMAGEREKIHLRIDHMQNDLFEMERRIAKLEKKTAK